MLALKNRDHFSVNSSHSCDSDVTQESLNLIAFIHEHDTNVSTIPPIYERPTASNISIEQGGDLILSSCNRQTRLSFASRGVRSRPPGEEIRSSLKTEMTPLLSPTMETEFLKEPWTNGYGLNSLVDGDKNNQNFSVWEENFQDLSGWCMDQFPEQCDIPIGEAINPKLSDMRFENEAMTLEKGVPEGFTIVYDEKINSNEDILHIADPLKLQPVVKFEQLEPSYTLADTSDVWLNVTGENTIEINNSTAITDIASNTSVQPKDGNLKLHLPSQETQAKNLDPLEPSAFSTFVSYEPESFDLLSYLCDDEVALPSSSTSSAQLEVLESKRLKEEATQRIQTGKKKLRVKNIQQIKKGTELRESNSICTSSASSSLSTLTYLEKSTKLKERIEKSRKRSAKLVKEYYQNKRKGVKRTLESDSEDQEQSDNSYRESREKNNEASRKSRMNKKVKETEMAKRAVELEKDNKILKMKVEELEKLVTAMRMTLLQSALKREDKNR